LRDRRRRKKSLRAGTKTVELSECEVLEVISEVTIEDGSILEQLLGGYAIEGKE
jgi:hypothetical protein